ncbi:hypothetical protein AB6A40_005195 [Gnathostoma spinigerum]|uniref:Protein regulator of cytokinesis 1 n=1 Tax=Gnathostoma spinigerum TaxID=75299 RepID=A0ABD6EFN0_9BILA
MNRQSSARRCSVEFSTAEAVACVHETMNTLNALWDAVGMEDYRRQQRVAAFYKHIKDLLDEMVSSEKKMVDTVKTCIEEWTNEVSKLRKELNMGPFVTDAFASGSLVLYRALECERDSLLSLKQDRLKGQNEIIRSITSMAIKLGEELHEIHERNEILDNDELKKLKHLNEELMNRYEDRLSRSSQMQTDLCRWYEQMRVEPTDELMLYAMNVNLEEEDLMFDKTFMDEIEEAHRMARAEYSKWVEQARFDYSEAMIKLSDLWEQCHVPASERTFAPEFRSATHSSDDVEKVKNEVIRLEKIFKQRNNIYEKLSEWKKLWEEKVEYEKNSNDKSMYKNRGGSLQTILKRQKYISSHLPQLLAKLESATEQYNKEHPDDLVLIDGLSPVEHVRLIMEDYAFQREMEKYEKRNLGTPGMSSASPSKKHASRFPVNTPSPMFGATFMKTKSCSRIRNCISVKNQDNTAIVHPLRISGSTTSLMSIVTPVRPRTIGPKTSSPKDFDNPATDSGFRSLKRHLPPLKAEGTKLRNPVL